MEKDFILSFIIIMYVLAKSGPSLQNLVYINICAGTAAHSGPGLSTAKP